MLKYHHRFFSRFYSTTSSSSTTSTTSIMRGRISKVKQLKEQNYDFTILPLTLRKVEKKYACRELRQRGKIPGIIYGENENGEKEKEVLVSLPETVYNYTKREFGGAMECKVFQVLVLTEEEGQQFDEKEERDNARRKRKKRVIDYMKEETDEEIKEREKKEKEEDDEIARKDQEIDQQVQIIRQSKRTIPVVLRNVQMNPVTLRLHSLNYLRYKPGIQVSIPIAYFNEDASPGIRKGGWLKRILWSIPCKIYTKNIPPYFQIDVKECDINADIRLQDLRWKNDEIIPILPSNTLLARIKGKSKDMIEDTSDGKNEKDGESGETSESDAGGNDKDKKKR